MTSHVLFAPLQALGAEGLAHIDASLVEHLRGTEQLLRSWGASETVCAAGLYHAVYSTEGYAPALATLAERHRIADLIGVDAEALAYLYCACDREKFHPRLGTPAQRVFVDRFSESEYEIEYERLAQFCELTLANELEIAGRSARYRAKHRTELLRLCERMSVLVGRACRDACGDLLS
ncbi:MAG: DUF6817 domain-containing protein [Betaproteobacteria bacterium]